MNIYIFRIISVFVLLIFFSMTSQAQVIGSTFPDMQTSTADGVELELPKDTMGKYTLLGLAFSKKSEDDLNSWMEPIFWKFIHKPTSQTGQLFAEKTYDVNAYFVPMFTGVKTAATKTAKKQALKNLDPRLIPSVLFYHGKLKPYKDALDFQQKDIPYFFVLDKKGKIVYATSGEYTEEKMAKVEEMIDQ